MNTTRPSSPLSRLAFAPPRSSRNPVHPLWVLFRGATATQGFREGCPAWGRGGRAVPIPAGVIPEQNSGHRHAGAAAGTLPARACITSYVRQCWATAEPDPASLPVCASPALRPFLGPKAPRSHSPGGREPTCWVPHGTLCPVAFLWGCWWVLSPGPRCDPRTLILCLRTLYGTVLFHTEQPSPFSLKATKIKKKGGVRFYASP